MRLQSSSSDRKKNRLQTALDRLPVAECAEDYIPAKGSGIKVPDGIERREIFSDVFRIAWPGFVELMLTQLASMVDLMMVGAIGGNLHPEQGAMALTAVGLTTQPKFLLMAAFIAMNTGVTATIARYKGMQRPDKANAVVRQALMFTVVASLLISVFGFAAARPLVILMGSQEDTVTLWASQYLKIQMTGFFTISLGSSITASLRGVGDSRSSMYYNMIANLVNVVLNWVLIFGNLGFPALGVAGASLATVIGQLVALCIAFTIILRGNGYLKLEPKLGFFPDRLILTDLFQIGMPAMIEQLLMRTGMIIFSVTVAGLGTVAFAAHQICVNLQTLSFMTGQAFAISSTTLVGQSLGKRRPDMARIYGAAASQLGIGVGIILLAVFLFCGKPIVGLYNRSPEILEMGSKILIILAFVQPLQAMQFVLAGALRGAGDTRSVAVISTVTILFLRPVLAILLIRAGLGIYGAWFAVIADQALRSTLVAVCYFRGKWMHIRLRSEEA